GGRSAGAGRGVRRELDAGRAEAAGAAGAGRELFYRNEGSVFDFLDNELGDAVAAGELHQGVAVVHQQDLDFAAIAGVDQAGRVEKTEAVAQGQAGTGEDEAGIAGRDRQSEAGRDEGARPGAEADIPARLDI